MSRAPILRSCVMHHASHQTCAVAIGANNLDPHEHRTPGGQIRVGKDEDRQCASVFLDIRLDDTRKICVLRQLVQQRDIGRGTTRIDGNFTPVPSLSFILELPMAYRIQYMDR